MTTEDAEPTELAGIAESDTQSAYAWGLAEPLPDESPQRPRSWFIVGSAVAASLTVVVVAAWVAVPHLRQTRTTPAPPVGLPTTTMVIADPPPSVAPSPQELNAAAGQFIAEMKGFGVPVSDQDPQWTVDLARAICATAQGNHVRYPPGTHTVIVLIDGVMENNPDWTRQQASRLTNGAVDHYCPTVRGPSPQEIGMMAADDRYLATLQDQLGVTPVDDSLVRVAHQVCIRKSQGWLNNQVIDAMNSPNSRDHERVIVETAIGVYCPGYR